jgi:hypothetical protein
MKIVNKELIRPLRNKNLNFRCSYASGLECTTTHPLNFHKYRICQTKQFKMWSVPFWVVTRAVLVHGYRRHGTAYQFHLQGSSSFFSDCLTLECGIRTTNIALCNIPEQQRHKLNPVGVPEDSQVKTGRRSVVRHMKWVEKFCDGISSRRVT